MRIKLEKKALGVPESGLLVVPVIAAKELGTGKQKSKQSTDPLLTFGPAIGRDLRALDGELGGLLRRTVKHFEFKPAAGKRLDIQAAGAAVRLSGLKAGSENPDGALLHEWRKLGGDAVQSAKRLRAKELRISLHQVSSKKLLAVISAVSEGLALGSYEFLKFKGKQKNQTAFPLTVQLLLAQPVSNAAKKALRLAEIRSEAVIFARHLVNTPPSSLLPKHLVDAARSVKAQRGSKMSIKVYNRAGLKRLRAEALLGVARGSDVEAYLVHLSYVPKRPKRRVTIIGKGITFDSGGLSIKTGKGMEDMKCDMSGAAAVISTMRAIAALKPDERPRDEIHMIVPTCENMINALSMKPGDVLRAMNGKTIEVLNTDAEGRLILADALSYSARFPSDITIDLATLTGACVVAVGMDYAGLFTADEELEKELRQAGAASGENLWPLPLAEEYRAQMDSDVADLKNIGSGGPGATLGALFLREFVPTGTRWAHLDIAGPAFVTKSNEVIKRGGTGFGVLTLLEFLGISAK